jgi:hypothetical protein
MKINNIEEIKYNLWWKEQNLILAKFCIKKYQETKEEIFLEYYKIFNDWSILINQQYLTNI